MKICTIAPIKIPIAALIRKVLTLKIAPIITRKNVTPQALDHTLSQLNFNACGAFPKSIVYYMSDGSTVTH